MTSDTKNVLETHEKLGREMREEYGFPEFLKLRSLTGRKNMQIAFLANPLRQWERLALNDYGAQHSYQLHKNLIGDAMRRSLLPKLEAYYDCRIQHCYLFDPNFSDDYVYSVVLKIFEKPLFKEVEADNAPLEEKLAKLFSRQLRELNGRGPEQSWTTLCKKHFVVFQAKGVLPLLAKEMALQSEETMKVLKKLQESLASKAIDNVCKAEFAMATEKFIEFDIQNNQLVAVAILAECAEMKNESYLKGLS